MIMKIEEKRNSLLKEFKKSLRELRLVHQIDILQESLIKIKDINMNPPVKEKSTQRHVTKRTKALIKRDKNKKTELNESSKNVMKWLDTLQDDADFIDRDRTEKPTFEIENKKEAVKTKTPESLNIDSLLSSYKKSENNDEPLPPLIVFSDEEEDLALSDTEDMNNNLDNNKLSETNFEIDKKVSALKEMLKGSEVSKDTINRQEVEEIPNDCKEESSNRATIVPLMMVLRKLMFFLIPIIACLVTEWTQWLDRVRKFGEKSE